MKVFALCIVAICTATIFTSCSNKDNSKTDSVSAVKTEVTEEQASSVLDGEVFEEIPDEAVECFHYIADESEEIFSEAEGKWMYGYKGTENVDGNECYVFAVYTYKDKTHSKEGVVATSAEGDSIYLLNDETEEYEPVKLTETESSWADTETLAFAN